MIERIMELLKEINPYEQISEDTELIESGILDSLSIIALVTQLEDEFEIEIADDDITVKNFSTVMGIMQLVEYSNSIQ